MEDNVLTFPRPNGVEQHIRAQVRRDCAAVVAIMQKRIGDVQPALTMDELEDALSLLNKAWGAVAGLMIAEVEREA
ncbi:MAG: hypothetical protein ACK52K_10135 [Alphaproteobacteria bacterium]